jgi:hypothetical protein
MPRSGMSRSYTSFPPPSAFMACSRPALALIGHHVLQLLATWPATAQCYQKTNKENVGKRGHLICILMLETNFSKLHKIELLSRVDNNCN